jgi:hypothetical protein
LRDYNKKKDEILRLRAERLIELSNMNLKGIFKNKSKPRKKN